MKKQVILLASIAIILNGCVPKRELISAQSRVKQLQNDSAGTHSKLSDCNSQVSTLEQEKMALQKSQKDLSASSQLNQLNSQMTIEEQAARLRTLEGLIQGQRDVMNKLKKTIADALVNFKPDELTVTLKDGKLYVSLQEKLLFKSGSAEVDPKGKEALKTLATVLNTTTGITIDIEGHTDTIPMTGKYEDNWALSTARATSITRILIKDYNVNPHNVIASGRSKYYPVADNITAEGRAKNRRTEIILSPDLTDLFKLLNQ